MSDNIAELAEDEARDCLVTGFTRGGIAIGVIAGTLMQSWWVSGPVAIVCAALAIPAMVKAMRLYMRSDL